MAAAAVTVAATAGVLVHRLTAADQLSTARAELDRRPAGPDPGCRGRRHHRVGFPDGAAVRGADGRRRTTAAARTPESIANGDLDARVRPDGRDEITRLAASMNTMADALGARLEAERRVTADIAHELRTPSAGMPTACAACWRWPASTPGRHAGDGAAAGERDGPAREPGRRRRRCGSSGTRW